MNNNNDKIICADFTPIEGQEAQQNKQPEKTSPTMKDLTDMIKLCREMVEQAEFVYNQLKNEYELTVEQVNRLRVYNDNHYPDAEPAEEENRSPADGLSGITEEEVVEIFGDISTVICPGAHNVTVDRIKSIYEAYVDMLTISAEYKRVMEQYQTMIDDLEKVQIDSIKKAYEEEKDPTKKEVLGKAIKDYEEGIELAYLANEIPEREILRIKRTFTDESKIKYLIDRATRKLDTLKLPRKYILEISKFETRFLEEKYHSQDGALLIYILYDVGYCDPYDKKTRLRVITTATMLDRLIRNILEDDLRDKIMNNILKMEDQILTLKE